MNYIVTAKQVKAINVMIRVLEEAINRNTFTKDEIEKIVKTVDILSKTNVF